MSRQVQRRRRSRNTHWVSEVDEWFFFFLWLYLEEIGSLFQTVYTIETAKKVHESACTAIIISKKSIFHVQWMTVWLLSYAAYPYILSNAVLP